MTVGGEGDIAMLQYSGGSKYPSFQLLVNHDDATREFAYSENTNASLKAVNKKNLCRNRNVILHYRVIIILKKLFSGFAAAHPGHKLFFKPFCLQMDFTINFPHIMVKKMLSKE